MENKRPQMPLDGAWRFNIDRRETGEEDGWHSWAYSDLHWGEFPVPGNWDAYLPELFGYGGIGWYRRSFSIRPTWEGRKIHLRFEGANFATTVWLNGKLVGSHSGGFEPFEFDVTGLVKWDALNTISARVDNWPKINRVPNSLAGWWNYGGIYHSVVLKALPEVRIGDVFVHSAQVVDGRPLLVTEFGAEAMLELHGDNYGSQEEQASILADRWQVFQEFRDSIPGALIWSLADYWHMPMGPDFNWSVNRYYFCHGGLTLDHLPKKATETVGQLFQSIKG